MTLVRSLIERGMSLPVTEASLPGPAPGLLLRQREAEDDPALFHLFGSPDFHRNGSLCHPFPSLEVFRAFLDSLGERRLEVVASLGARVVGYAGLYPMGDRQAHIGSFTLCVDADHQRMGIGSALMSAILRAGYALLGLERIQATVFTDNARALRLYSTFGFTIEGRIARFARREDGFVDAFLIARLFDLPRPH